MPDNTVKNRSLIRKYLDVPKYANRRIEIRVNRAALPYVEYDRLSQIDQGAVNVHQQRVDIANRRPARAYRRPGAGADSDRPVQRSAAE